MLCYWCILCHLQIEQFLHQMYLVVCWRLFIHTRQSLHQICCGLFLYKIMCNRPRQSKPDNSQYLSVKKSPFLSLHSLRFCLQERQMQFPPIKIIFNLHPPIHKVCAIKLFYSKRLSYFLYHCSHSNLTLGSDTSYRELNRISNLWETKNRENTRQRKKKSHAQDNIYVVRQFSYVHEVAGISLLLGKNTEYKMRLQYFLSL